MKVVFLLDNPFVDDRRVYREAHSLVEAGHEVVLFAVFLQHLLPEEVIDGILVKRIFPVEIYDLKQRKLLKSFIPAIILEKPDVIHCHDQLMLHLGAGTKIIYKGIILVYDSHELFHAWPIHLAEPENRWLWLKSAVVRKIQVILERRNAKYVDYLVTVNNSLASDLRKYLRIPGEVTVIRNLPEKQDFPKTNILREYFKIAPDTKILVFIGASVHAKTLNLEQVMEEVGNKPGLAFILISGEGSGKRELMMLAESCGYRNVFFHPKLKPDQIGAYLASADVGLVPTWNKKDLSYWFALDNKLFEYMMSEIPVLATLQPEYLSIIGESGIGICINPDEKDSYYLGFLNIINRYPNFTDKLKKSKTSLNWDFEKMKLLHLYNNIERSKYANDLA